MCPCARIRRVSRTNTRSDRGESRARRRMEEIALRLITANIDFYRGADKCAARSSRGTRGVSSAVRPWGGDFFTFAFLLLVPANLWTKLSGRRMRDKRVESAFLFFFSLRRKIKRATQFRMEICNLSERC